MAYRVRVKVGLLARLREVRGIPSEEVQARALGVDRSTLRRIDRGAQPSGGFMAAVCEVYSLGIGEAFEAVPEGRTVREAVTA